MNITPIGRKPGRPPDPLLSEMRRLFPGMSDRSIARMARAERILNELGVDSGGRARMVKLYRYKNGNFSVSGFLQHAEAVLNLTEGNS